jgi:hypothetical protein
MLRANFTSHPLGEQAKTSPSVTFLPQNISVVLQLAAAGTHLYEQRKRENADRCLPALGTPPDANPCMENAGSRGEFKLWEGS